MYKIKGLSAKAQVGVVLTLLSAGAVSFGASIAKYDSKLREKVLTDDIGFLAFLAKIGNEQVPVSIVRDKEMLDAQVYELDLCSTDFDSVDPVTQELIDNAPFNAKKLSNILDSHDYCSPGAAYGMYRSWQTQVFLTKNRGWLILNDNALNKYAAHVNRSIYNSLPALTCSTSGCIQSGLIKKMSEDGFSSNINFNVSYIDSTSSGIWMHKDENKQCNGFVANPSTIDWNNSGSNGVMSGLGGTRRSGALLSDNNHTAMEKGRPAPISWAYGFSLVDGETTGLNNDIWSDAQFTAAGIVIDNDRNDFKRRDWAIMLDPLQSYCSRRFTFTSPATGSNYTGWKYLQDTQGFKLVAVTPLGLRHFIIRKGLAKCNNSTTAVTNICETDQNDQHNFNSDQ